VTDLLQSHPNLALLALDQMSPYYQATLTRVWAPVGQTPIVRLHPQRDHIHFYGALELRTGREIALPAEEQTSLVTADFIRILLLLYPTQPVLLLLDRAPWHFGDEIRLLFAENADRLDVLYFPPACPDLNPQEHVWSQARDAISHNHAYPAFETLIDDFEAYLNETPFDTNFMEKYAPLHLGDYANPI
jgi:transposase